MEKSLLWLINTFALKPIVLSALSSGYVSPGEALNIFEACDGVQRDEMVHNEIRTGGPACSIVA